MIESKLRFYFELFALHNCYSTNFIITFIHSIIFFNKHSEFGTISPEASFVNVFTFTGAFTGAFYGGLLHSRIENMNFRESNEATLYYSQKTAQSALMDRTTIGFGKGALRFGIRYAIFFFSFSYVTIYFKMTLTT